MDFVVDPGIFARFPGVRVVAVVAAGIDNEAERPDITETWRAAWAEAGRAGAAFGNAQSHPRVKPWREGFKALGISPKSYPSSVEAMLRRALRGGEPFAVNPLVDLYNAVSLRYTVPVGGFDLEALRGPLELRGTRAGDRFLALDAAEPVEVPPGEVAYADGPTVLTRHLMWRQSREGLLLPGTSAVVLLSEIAGELGAGLAEAVREDLAEGLRRHFGVAARGMVVDEGSPRVSLDP